VIYGYATEPIRTGLQLVTGPGLVLTPSDAKGHARIDGSLEDYNVQQWIAAAARKVERDTERALLTQTWQLALDAFPSWRGAIDVPLPPLASVNFIKYYDSANVLQTLDPSAYIVDTIGNRIGLAPTGSWPTDLRSFRPGLVEFVAGAVLADAIPENLLHAVRLAVAWLSENREPTKADVTSYDALIAPFVVPAIG
jgi:uncharacterized phiE125 gp8 family phage protein